MKNKEAIFWLKDISKTFLETDKEIDKMRRQAIEKAIILLEGEKC